MQKVKTHSIKAVLEALSIGKYEMLFSFIFTAIFVLGYLLSTYSNIDTKDVGGRLVIGYIGGYVVIWSLVLFCLSVIKQWHFGRSGYSGPVFLGGFSDKKLWPLTSLAIFVCYLPLIFMSYSVLTPDSWNSIAQITGELPLSNAHPLIFTAFVSVFIHTGLLFGSLEFGTLLFSLAQSAILAMIFARIVIWMRQEKVGKYGILATLYFYAILPINAIAGIIMWKDILFAGFGILFLMMLRKLYVDKNRFFSRKNVIYYILLAFLFCTLRNNGLYAYILFFVLVIIINHKTLINKKHLLLLSSPIVLAVAYLSLTSLIAKPTTASYAMMCVPMQQVARTVKYHSNALTNEERATINEILPLEKLGEIYNPNLSDPVMGSFNAKAFEEDKGKYLKLWLKLFTEHPKTYLAATLYNTYGYLYPYYPSPTTTDIVMNNTIHPNALKNYSDNAYDRGDKPALATYNATISSLAPVVRNIGFYTSVILLGAYVAIYRKKRELTGVFIVLFCLFLSTVMGPVNGEFRYLYLFVVALPFILVSVYADNKTKKPRIIKHA